MQKKKNNIDIEEMEALCFQDLNTVEDKIISNEEKISIYKKMQNLDDKTREVMYLRITGELSFKEIGVILNKTENWARVTFYRGKNKLKEGDENEKL
jgi:RNA polymerase sigma-70 factor (ECF subfamily)